MAKESNPAYGELDRKNITRFVKSRWKTMNENADASQSHFCVRITATDPVLDSHGRAVHADIRQIGLAQVEGVRSSRIFMVEGHLNRHHVDELARSLLADPVAESFVVTPGFDQRRDDHPAIEIHPQPGVMNPTAGSALQAGSNLLASRFGGNATLAAVQTGRRYEIIDVVHSRI
ncbi:MAG: phosphoribosylformylglycinamidine synthase subunit PurS [Planctomycetota bacterium]|jgi:phosphoribosylformylglycinamidine synthase